jgi:hypothetical protein
MERNQQHVQIADALLGIEPSLQKMLAEMVLIRLFDDLQEALSGMAYRLACGTSYIDGTTPTLLTSPARSTQAARTLFEIYGRQQLKYVRWSRVAYIKETTKYVLASSDPFIAGCDRHSLTISELQAIRNRIAHKNSASRRNFDVVLRRYYGATPRNVTPGLLLLTPRISPSPLQIYLTATRIIARECARG